MEVFLVALEEKFVTEIYAVFVSADFVESVHIKLSLEKQILV